MPTKTKAPAKTKAGVGSKASGNSSAKSQTARVIKKYPNRRLYDTNSSAYITLTEVKQLVLDAKAFVVQDAKTQEDLTRSILLQIILEAETAGVPMFSEASLANIIRFYGHSMQGLMGSTMEKNLQAFTDVQAKMAEQAANFAPGMGSGGVPGVGHMPGVMSKVVEQSHTMFAQMQEQMQKQTEQMFGAFGMKR